MTPPESEILPTAPRGLTDAEARERLRVEGPNELPRSKKRHLLKQVLDILKEPMILLLVATHALASSTMPPFAWSLGQSGWDDLHLSRLT